MRRMRWPHSGPPRTLAGRVREPMLLFRSDLGRNSRLVGSSLQRPLGQRPAGGGRQLFCKTRQFAKNGCISLPDLTIIGKRTNVPDSKLHEATGHWQNVTYGSTKQFVCVSRHAGLGLHA